MVDTGYSESAATRFESYLAPILTSAYGIALHLTRHRDDAEDLVQEAALQSFRAFDSFQEGTNFKAWFCRILTNLFINAYRKRQRTPEIDTLSGLEDAPALYLFKRTQEMGIHAQTPDPAALVLEKVEAEQVHQAIATLPEDYRIVATLYFMEEFAYQEIAAILGCPIGTVRSRLHRGRRMLQKALWDMAEQRGIVAALRSTEASSGS
jgi:RNA polymerase sigma-70 factor (ECF subfamily)